MHDGIVIALFITAGFAIMAAAEWVILRFEKREEPTENDELLELINSHARTNRIQREQDQAILDKATRFRADFS